MKKTFSMSHSIIASKQWIELSMPSKILYQVLCRLSDKYKTRDNKWFFRSIRHLAEETGLNKDTITKARNELIDRGFIVVNITKDHNRKKATKYHILPSHLFGHK